MKNSLSELLTTKVQIQMFFLYMLELLNNLFHFAIHMLLKHFNGVFNHAKRLIVIATTRWAKGCSWWFSWHFGHVGKFVSYYLTLFRVVSSWGRACHVDWPFHRVIVFFKWLFWHSRASHHTVLYVWVSQCRCRRLERIFNVSCWPWHRWMTNLVVPLYMHRWSTVVVLSWPRGAFLLSVNTVLYVLKLSWPLFTQNCLSLLR